jgi:small conductance mechanosensitive channel
MVFEIPYWNEIRLYMVEHSFSLFISFVVLIVGVIAIFIINRIIAGFFSRTRYDETLKKFFQRSVSIFLWTVLLIVIVSNLGVNVTGFIAGLGIAGFIIGFATKDIFSNIAAGLLILITKPFKVRDEVEISGLRGEIKEINLSFCSMISEHSVLIIIPNAKIWGNPIKNFSRLSRPTEQIIKK